MKTEPTDIDRLAAQLFAPAGGMRAGWRRERSGMRPVWERLRDGSEATPDFYDTDDPATVGAMLAQVEKAEGVDMPVEVYRVTNGWFGTDCPGGGGPTRGAALVAAMRTFKGAP